MKNTSPEKNTVENLETNSSVYENIKFKYKDLESLEAALQKTSDKISLLVSSDDDLMNRYQENMVAFAEYHPEIHDFFKNYEPKKYIVDTAHGFVNAVNVDDGSYFYSYPSYLMSKLQFEDFQANPLIKKFHFFNKKKRNTGNFIHVDFLEQLTEINDKRKAEAETLNTTTLNKNLSSIVLFGLGAGYHLEMLAIQHTASCIFVIEPDLDLFYLSFFAINWKLILETLDERGSRLHISLGEQSDTFFDDIMLFSAKNGRYQLCQVAGYLHYQSKALNDILDVFNKRYLEFGRGYGFFDDAVMSVGHTLSNISNNIGLVKSSACKKHRLDDIPVFILGNGPSLDNLIPYIKKHRSKAVVISCGSTLSALYKYNLKPDIHCEQERTSTTTDILSIICPKDFLKDILFIAPATVHPGAFKLFSKSIMALKANESGSELVLEDKLGKKLFESYQFMNPTVANASLTIATALGFKNFYFMGVDLGQKQDGNHHSKNSLYYDDKDSDEGLYYFNKKQSALEAGNFGGSFICDRSFKESNDNIARQIAMNPSINCFNASDGALIKGAGPLAEDELDKKLTDFDDVNFLDVKNYLLDECILKDNDGTFYKQLVNNLDYDVFSQVCQMLRDSTTQPTINVSDCADVLLKQTEILRGCEAKIHDLLIGTLLHFQVCLSQFLYGETVLINRLKNFKEGLAIYQNFLDMAPNYYRDNALEEHVINNSVFINRLKKAKS
ncbi:MAG: DUF115 domain-containing protein [Colwellia sp.]|nr:DUF115 domain-containing protein [Colwellia sp.]